MALNPAITDWRGRRAWIVGASSGIGAALALPLDVRDAAALQRAASRLHEAFGGLDLAVYCAGTYRPLRAADFDLDCVLEHDEVNYRGALRWLAAVLPLLQRQRGAHLSLVASVAGWRGLPQALAYGPTKAALINLAETLYVDLRDLGVAVSVVNPGFVDTPLTARNRFAMPALLRPEQAAEAILQGWRRGRFDIHFPRRFTLWLRLLRCLPYRASFAVTRRFTGL